MNITASFNMKSLEIAFLTEFASRLNSFIPSILQKIQPIIYDLINSAVKNSNEYIAMIAGDLFGQFGEVNIVKAIEDIIKAISDNVKIDVNKFAIAGNQISGSFTVNILRLDYSEVLSLPSVSFISNNGFQIEWLKWLLLESDRIVVNDYSFSLNARTVGFSRTGTGVMVRGTGWGVPSVYAGTAVDNWLTRALQQIDEKVIKELYSIIDKL